MQTPSQESQGKLHGHHFPLLVCITGSPGTGKTTLAGLISSALGHPLLSRDEFKEELWELWQYDEELLRLVPRAHYGIYYSALAIILTAGVSVVCEGSVHAEYGAAELARLTRMSRLIVVHCQTSRRISHSRFIGRAQGARHPSHRDSDLIADIQINSDRWRHFEQVVNIDAPTLIIDTTIGYKPSLDQILLFISRNMSS